MNVWSGLVLAKALLHARGQLRLNVWLELGFLVAAAVPEPKNAWARRSRIAVLVLAAAAITWSESWLPPLAHALDFASQSDTRLPAVYMLKFLAGAVPWLDVAAAASLLGLAEWARRKAFNAAPLAVAAVVVSPFIGFGTDPKGLQSGLEEFYRGQEGRVVRLPEKPQDVDLVFLHVCSMSWDDLESAGLEPGVLGKLDALYTGFNTATAYSGSAMLRLSTSLCGQRPHADLYRPLPPECYLFDSLRRSGYEVFSQLNHRGSVRHFAEHLSALGRAPEPLGLDGLPSRLLNFDGEPMVRDYDALEKVWKARLASRTRRAAIYYNTITPHGGVHRVDDARWWTRSRRDLYREAVTGLSEDLERFFELVAASGRRVAVVLVPEHGMGLRGVAIQGAELRDIPLPQITRVPAGIKLVGPWPETRPIVVDEPVSYLAVLDAVAGLLAGQTLESAAADPIPSPFVAENQEARVLESHGRWFIDGKRGWEPLPPTAVRVSLPGIGR